MTSPVSLESLWIENNTDDLSCLACHGHFHDSALVRTFIVKDPAAGKASDRDCSRTIVTPSGHQILFFDRHLQCLLESGVPFAAVSHVWDPDISATQNSGPDSPIAAHVVNLALSIPIKIYNGFLQSFSGDADKYELWHDYYSVPQWTAELKNKILPIIHRLFNRARLVVVSLNDVSRDSVRNLYHGETPTERLSGVSAIVTAKWFSRMWTAMELIQSNRVKTMTSDYTMADTEDDDPVFLKRLRQVWNEELRKYPDIHSFQNANNLSEVPGGVPLQGPLLQLKELKRSCFAVAWVTLSYRGCRDLMDFLHGLRGIVVGGTEPLPPQGVDGFWKQVSHVMRGCLLAGDLSPLLMTPAITMFDPRLYSGEDGWMNQSYYDVWTWELREEVHPSTLAGPVIIDEVENTVSADLEVMGPITAIHCLRVNGQGDWWDSIPDLAIAARLTIDTTGPDLERFVATLGTQIYGEETEYIMSQLKENGHIEKLQKVLDKRHESKKEWELEGEDSITWLADAMTISRPVKGLAESRMGGLLGRFGTMHCFPYDPLLEITCPSCLRPSLFRSTSFIPVEELHGARAYRIPGLQYYESLRNGMSLLVKDGRVVGRTMWAVPACNCHETETVRMKMPELLLPKGQPPRFHAVPELMNLPRS